MTTRRRKPQESAKAEEPTQETTRIPQEELENFFTDVAPHEVKEAEEKFKKKRVRPSPTGKVFLGEEDVRQFNAYKKFLKESQGITDIRHKKI